MYNRKYILDFGAPYTPEIPPNDNLFFMKDSVNSTTNPSVSKSTEVFAERVEGDISEEVYERDNGRRIRNLNIAFEIEKTNELSSSKCEITIYNLSDSSIAILEKNKGLKTFVRLRAGYDYSAGPSNIEQDILLRAASDLNGRRDSSIPQGVLQIFKGVVESFESYMDGPDRVTVLTCNDAPDFAWAVSSHEFPKGTSYKYIVSVLLRDLNLPIDVSEDIPEVLVTQRPMYLYGKTSDLLLQLGESWGFRFSVADMAMSITQKSGEDAGKTRGFAPVIGFNSGLIGKVEPADDTTDSTSTSQVSSGKSVKFTSLMRGDILPQQPIFLQSKSIVAGTPVEGFYRVTKVTHKGEYEGNDWYSIVEAEEASELYSLLEIARDNPLTGGLNAPPGAV